ncbi:MAG: peptidoglycan-binding domain-containing protein [Polyangiales bacterium]
MTLPLTLVDGGFSYRFVHRQDLFRFDTPAGYEPLDAVDARQVLERELQRSPWRVAEFLRCVTCQGVARYEFEGAPWSSPYVDISRARYVPWLMFEDPFGEILCFRRRIPLPPPPVVEEVVPAEVVPGEWIEISFVDPEGNPVVVGIELELPSGRVIRSNSHAMQTTDRAGNARLTCTPNPGDRARQLHILPGYHTIRQGQDMQSIAWAYGRTDWRAIWEDSNNDELREACPEPMVLMPGEQVYVPEADDNQRESLPMGQRHEVVIEVPKTRFYACIQYDGVALANATVSIESGDVMMELTADGSGIVDQELPALLRDVTVRVTPAASSITDGVPRAIVYTVSLGTLNPASNVTGAKQRLRNLGFYRGAIDASLGPDFGAAVALFQLTRDLDQTGELDSDTLRALEGESAA